MNGTLVKKLATKVRAAIESIPRDRLPISMSNFPKGACGDVALLLGAYFADNGMSGFHYVCGKRGVQEDKTWSTHAWLESEGLVVDITADQFDDVEEKVIVVYGSSWHAQFAGSLQGAAISGNGAGSELIIYILHMALYVRSFRVMSNHESAKRDRP